MPLGKKLGPYEILSPLGAGGMGEVFRARDTRLGRDVAIKVLPKDFAADQTRLRRFEQEAKTLATLNHPNVLSIFDTGIHEGAPYLVSELLEGHTLREVLKPGPLTPRKTVEHALQIAQGLAAAHAKGIVHRDLKPDNIFVTQDGRTKILDFGLAKLTAAQASGPADPDAPTVVPKTEPGVVMGTVGYMSPEQVNGVEADHRSDIFSFGAIFYEMLSGARAFRKESSVQTMNAILTEEPPDLIEKNPNLSPAIERVVRRCLEKQPERRFQSASDLAFALENISGSTAISARAAAQARSTLFARLREMAAWAVAAVLLIVTVVLGWRMKQPTNMSPPTLRLSIVPQPEQLVGTFVLSPDGRSLAAGVVGPTNSFLAVRPLNSLEWRVIPDSSPAGFLFWSPDSRQIGFFSGGKLKITSAEGGRPRTICDARGGGGTMNQAGVIVYSEYWGGGLFRVSAEGGEPVGLTKLNPAEQEDSHLFPHFLPDGKHFLFLTRSSPRNQFAINIGSLDTAEPPRRLFLGDVLVDYVLPGFILFVREGSLYAQPFDPSRLAIKGSPFVVIDQVSWTANSSTATVSVSQNGVLAYRAINAMALSQLSWFDRTGSKMRTIGSPGRWQDFSLNRSNGDIAASKFNFKTGNSDVWRIDAASGVEEKLNSIRDCSFPLWSPDGTTILYCSDHESSFFQIYRRTLDRSKPEEPFYKSEKDKGLTDWSSDERYFLYGEVGQDTSGDVWVYDCVERKPRALVRTKANERGAKFSPDGKWIAYQSDESEPGRSQIYVQSFPSGDVRIPISRDGGRSPRWRSNGREIYFISPDKMLMAVEVQTDETRFKAGSPKALFRMPEDRWSLSQFSRYDVSADGQQFLIMADLPNLPPQQIVVVMNWLAELKK